MKKVIWIILAALLIGTLAGCGGGAEIVAAEKRTSAPVKEKEATDEKPIKQTLSAVTGESDEAGHTHEAYEGDNILPHEAMGYCGNTMTEVSYSYLDKSDDIHWTKSFWGSKSVRLTDLLLNLDYCEDMCKCLPEYTVNTEFGEDYGVSLTEGYARHGDKQVSLTDVQLEMVTEILTELAEASFQDGNCLD